jgi:propanol-preferring alcohol dehydrogenase
VQVRRRRAGQLAALTEACRSRAIIDCVGAEETIQLGFAMLATEGAFASVGLVGEKIEIPLFPFVAREFSYFGSFWGNHRDLLEVLALAQGGKVKHSIEGPFRRHQQDHRAARQRRHRRRAVIVYD